MSRNNIGVVVTVGDTAVGLFTERDLLNRVVAQGQDPGVTTMSETCSYDLITIDHDYNCEETARNCFADIFIGLTVAASVAIVGLLL